MRSTSELTFVLPHFAAYFPPRQCLMMIARRLSARSFFLCGLFVCKREKNTRCGNYAVILYSLWSTLCVQKYLGVSMYNYFVLPVEYKTE